MPIRYPTVSIRITKGRQFRALVQEDDHLPPYEITVGGEDWVNRKKTSPKAREKIKKHIACVFEKLKSQYEASVLIDAAVEPRHPPIKSFKISYGWV